MGSRVSLHLPYHAIPWPAALVAAGGMDGTLGPRRIGAGTSLIPKLPKKTDRFAKLRW